MTLPIFVLGRNRSGTTWLANQLCEHPDIAGVQHERHHGVHESAYFLQVDGRYGDLAERVNYAEFVEVMAASDYFRLAGADTEFLYSLWPTTYEDVFRHVLDRFAERQGARAWLDKTNVREGPLWRQLGAYPDARFVGIVRELTSTCASQIRNRSFGRWVSRAWALVRIAADWVYVTKTLDWLDRHYDRAIVVRYEEMRRDLESVMRRILEFLGLPWDPAVLGQTYKPQSSFRSRGERGKELSRLDKAVVKTTAAFARLTPRWGLRLLDRWSQWRRGRQSLPWWFFRLQPFFEDDPAQYDEVFGTGQGEKAEEA